MSEAMTNRLAQLCRELKIPAVGLHAERLAKEAIRGKVNPLSYLLDLLEAERDSRRERRAARRLKEACFPVVKSLESFDFDRAPSLPEVLLRELATGTFIDDLEPVVFLGEPGTGKTHLATALGFAAASEGRRVRFVTAAKLVTDLIEARDAKTLGRMVAKYARYELLILDELGYLPLSRSDADLLFRVLSERSERRATVVTTNLPFSEWTSVFPDPRLCRAVIDRLTHNAHIIETGVDSIRLQKTLEHKQKRTRRPRKA